MWRARTPSCSTATLRSPMPPNDRGARRAPPSDRSRRRPPPRCRFPQRDAVARRARQGIHTRPARPDGAARRLIAKGSRAWDTAAAAHRLLSQGEDGLLFVYLPECDRAGHAHGWMSEQYLEAAAQVDAGVGLLSGWTDDAVFIITADHGGGGVTANEHDQPHSVNDHIPLIVAGPGVTRRHQLTRAISLLDIPATVLWWFGVPVPGEYEGRPLAEAFAHVSRPIPPTPVPA